MYCNKCGCVTNEDKPCGCVVIGRVWIPGLDETEETSHPIYGKRLDYLLWLVESWAAKFDEYNDMIGFDDNEETFVLFKSQEDVDAGIDRVKEFFIRREYEPIYHAYEKQPDEEEEIKK